MFLRIGHRGARAYEVENTLESFGKAIELGANAVEFDVRLSNDGTPVVIHDDNLKKVFGKDVRVDEATVKELKELTGGGIPTIDEALRFIDGKVEKMLVELKEAGYEKKILDIIRKAKVTERVIIVSFLEEALDGVRSVNQKVETGLLYARHKNPVDTALTLGARWLLPMYRFVHTRDVEKAHKNNLMVVVWTINTKEEVKAYIAKGVDGIASDKPDILNP